MKNSRDAINTECFRENVIRWVCLETVAAAVNVKEPQARSTAAVCSPGFHLVIMQQRQKNKSWRFAVPSEATFYNAAATNTALFMSRGYRCFFFFDAQKVMKN